MLEERWRLTKLLDSGLLVSLRRELHQASAVLLNRAGAAGSSPAPRSEAVTEDVLLVSQ